jgi:DNA repair protein RecN (Recombination protein N)
VENLAIIERLELELGPGFNVLTGETGTGKSLVVDAVNLLVGGRGTSDLIRAGGDRALVQGVFSCRDNPQVLAYLEKAGISLEPDGSLFLTRELNRTGRHVCRIGGRTVGLSQYQELCRHLVDIHGQHEHQSLLDPQVQLRLLDLYGGARVAAQRRAVAEAWQRWRRAEEQLAELERQADEEEKLKELWEFQLKEISAARVRPGEDEELEREERLLAGAEKLCAASEQAYHLLFGGGEASAYDLISRAASQLRSAQNLDPSLAAAVQALEGAAVTVQEQADFLREYRQRLNFSPSRLAEVQSRLHLLKQLCKKYGGSLEEVLEYAEGLKNRLEGLTDRTERLACAERERTAAKKEYWEKAEALSDLRREAADRLERGIAGVLAELAMPNAAFRVVLGAGPPGPAGVNTVEFVFTANPGEPLRPVTKVASGGELSRLMLALKSLMAGNDAIPTLIFDEIDAGLGGAAARAVGEKLRDLSRWHQVICVTHAPQIAAYAERHFYILKEESGGRTVTRVRQLDHEERIEELARMLAGRVDAASLAHARELLEKL